MNLSKVSRNARCGAGEKIVLGGRVLVPMKKQEK